MKASDYLWLIIPISIISLVVLSFLFIEPEEAVYDWEGQQLFEQTQYCGPGGSSC